MKKVLSIVLALTLCVCCLGLTACSASGTYKFSKLVITVDGEEKTFKAGDDIDLGLLKITVEEKNYPSFTLNKDGTVGDSQVKWEEKDGFVYIAGVKTYEKKGLGLKQSVKIGTFSAEVYYK